MRYLVLLLQFLLICGTFAVNPKSDQSSDVLSNYLKKIHKDYEITGYNLHNLLKKDSPIENQAKIKINKLFGINLKLLETLDQIIKDEQYPSLFLSQDQSNDIQETQQQTKKNEEDNNEETEEPDENNDNNSENNEQQQYPPYAGNNGQQQYPQNEEDNNEETEEPDENDNNTAENNGQQQYPPYVGNNEQQQYPLNAENNNEESGEEEEEEEEDEEKEEEEEEKEEEEEEEKEEEDEDDDKNDSKNGTQQQNQQKTEEQLIEEEFSPEDDDENSDDQRPYPDWNRNYNQRINQNNGNPIPQEYAQFSPEDDEDSDDQQPYPGWNGYYNNQNGMGFPIDPANNELIFEYRNNQNSIDKNNISHNLRRIQKAKNAIFGSFDDADFQDDDEDVNENQYPYENYNQLNQPYNNQNYGNNIDTIQLQSDSIQPENPYDMSQYNDQQYQYMNNNYPNSNQIQLESDAIGQYQDMNNNYPNSNQLQYRNRSPNVSRNNRKSQRTDTRNQQNLSPLQLESDSFDNPNDNNQQDDYPETNNNRQLTQTRLQNNSFNRSVSNYPQSYDPRINNYGPNTPNRQQVVNNRQNMYTNNTSYFNGNKSIQGNQQAWIQNQKESYGTPNTSVNSAQNYPYNRGMPINQGLSPIMQNPSNNIPNNVMSQSFNGTPVPTQTSNSTLNKYIIYQPKPKKPVITDPKKRPKLHDLRNFLNEPTVEVVKSPAQEEEDSRHSYLYSTGDYMDYDIFSDELHANHF